MQVTINVSPKDILLDAPRDELLSFILDLDLEVAEVDFSVELIKSLLRSLTADLDKEDLEVICKEAIKEAK